MKQIMEHMLTTILMVLTLFIFASILFVEMEIITARTIHTSAINQIQSSYYSVDIDKLNDSLHEKYSQKDKDGNYLWNLSAREDSEGSSTTSYARKDWVVTLDYAVYMPFFNMTKKGKIDGYAR